MTARWLIPVLLLLAACNSGGVSETSSGPAVADMAAAAPEEAAVAPPAQPGGDAGAAQVSVPLLAYEHEVRLEAPTDEVPALLRRHEQACTAAGPATCQVIGASTSALGEDQASGQLELRATPAWLTTFRARLEADAEGAGGRLLGASQTSEDLTRQIIDTEAQLRAKRTLRTRLEALLASRPGKLEELLQVEQELARVQAEIDTAESGLAVMRARVATSKLTIRYQSESMLAPDHAFTPMKEALTGFLRYLMASLAVLVTVVAVVLPWALIGAALVWLGRRRGWFRRKPKTEPTPPSPGA